VSEARLEAVLIKTTRVEELAEFYRAGLGLDPPKAYGADHLGFTLGNGYLGIERGDREGAGAVSIWFNAEEMEAAIDRLVKAGGTLESGPEWHEHAKEHLAVVLDPDGNRIGLIARA
jgi:predicted enzyme related to lactoylglutathione lyase